MKLIDTFRACYAIRDRLKRLKVRDIKGKIDADGFQAGYPLDFLFHFKSLTHLEIDNQSSAYTNKGLSTQTLQSVLATCPQLTDFKLDTDHFPIQAPVTNNLNPMPTPSPNKSQQIGKNLKVFALRVPWINVGHLVKYITAPGLDEFRLDATGDGFDVWVQDCDREELEGLIDILRATRQISINMKSGLSVADSRRTPLFSVIEQMSSEERLVKSISFITSLFKERKVLCDLNLTILGEATTIIYPLHIAVQNGRIAIKYGHLLKENSDAGISRLFSSVLGTVDMPMIYSININFHFNVDVSESFMDLTLENITSNCPYVTNICFSHPKIARCRFQSDIFNDLSNNNTNITPTKYSDFMATASTTPLLESFNCLKLSGTEKYFSPQFNHILSTSFHDIRCVERRPEKIATIRQQNNNQEGDTIAEKVPIAELDITDITHLQLFKFDFCGLESTNYQYCFFIIEHSSNGVSGDETKTMYYKCNYNCGMKDAEEALSIQNSALEEMDRMKSPEAHNKICAITIKFSSIDKITLYNSKEAPLKQLILVSLLMTQKNHPFKSHT